MKKIKWNDVKLNKNETGFICGGNPIFKKFRRVMSFHQEGIAAVYDETGAYHISLSGNPLYNNRYIETFGYYSGIATVRDENGYFHIDINGKPVHNKRFIWSGNFQENYCVVQSAEGYFHINLLGNEVYKKKYKYVGDFKYGIAVATNYENMCFHIESDGSKLNEVSYYSAGVYHKGYAVVKDHKGYYHVDKKGNELYAYRFKNLEVFYNGWALGEEVSGKKIRISEKGFKVYLTEHTKIIKARDVLELIKSGNKIGLFFRHSERYDGVNALIGDNVLLTQNGKEMAFNLGVSLKGISSVSFYSSPLERCKQTVHEISKGMGIDNSEVIVSKVLGDPGVYFDYDSEINCGVAMERDGFHNYVEKYFQNGTADGSIPLTSASEKLQDFILEHMSESLTFFNSHDFLVASFMRYSGVKYPNKNDFVDFIEGVLFVVDKNNKLNYYQFKDDITTLNRIK